MMTLANYGIKSNKYKDPISAKSLNKSLQIRNRAESLLKHCLKTSNRIPKDKRNDIIATLEEYYSRVPFNVVVWNTNQAKQCVVESILTPDHDFNPYKARNAFQIIEQMLINLEYLPWHKEFTKIFLYSGGFRHDISEPLVGPENIFISAGFEQESIERPMHLIIRPKKKTQIDGSDLIARVIFDCMLAQVIMSDIINVFENCCKTSKLAPQQVSNNDINCYSWIQEYFQERSYQIMERACSNIQELLNNLTNQLTKRRMTSVKTSSKNERPTDELGKVNEIPYSRKETCDTQQQKLLPSGSTGDSDLFRISDDLLKLPGYSEHENRSFVTRRDVPCSSDMRLTSQSDVPFHDSEVIRESPHRDMNSLHYTNHPLRSLTKSRESLDMIDGNLDYNHRDYPTHIIRPEAPINDRELLIPKQERKYVASSQKEFVRQDRSQQNVGNKQAYRSQVNILPGNSNDHYRLSAIGQSKANYSETSRFKNFPSNHLQPTSKGASSRYDNDATNNRYEYRNIDRPFNNRLYWSCNSCTFYNHTSNDVCEMCGNRKPL